MRTFIRKCCHIVIVFFILTFASLSMGQTILRVDGTAGSPMSATPPPDGLDWGVDAFLYLQDALEEARLIVTGSGTATVQVWVKGDDTTTGIVYRPDLGDTVSTDDPTETVIFRDRVSILGGFAGTETTKNARNPLVYLTVITGEIGNAGLSDNTYHIVTSIRNANSAVIDGFTIRDSNANNTAITNPLHRVGAGALILGLDVPDPSETELDPCQPGIVRCIFTNCHARFGGAVYVHVAQIASPLIGNCEFRDNSAYRGGAVHVEGLSGLVGGPTIVNGLFVGNIAEVAEGVSGSGNGGAMYLAASGVGNLINCTLTGNIAEGSGAGAVHHDDTCPNIPSPRRGPGLVSCIVWENDSPQLAGANGVVESCVDGLEGVCADYEFNVIDDDPMFVSGTNFRLSPGSPCIDEGDSLTIKIIGDPYDLDQSGSNAEPMADLDGRRRIVGAFSTAQDCRLVDMGAYEFGAGGCTGDVVPDGVVNIDDLLAVVGGWGPCPSAPTPCPGDIATAPCGDGEIDINDLLAVIGAWGDCPGVVPAEGGIASIPEDFWDCWNACSQNEDFGGCMEKCFKALCELGHTEYCE